MRHRLAALTQRLVRIAGVVVASGVGFVRSNRLCERLHCAPVIPGSLRHQAEKIEALHMCRLARENLAANLLRFVAATRSVQAARLSGEVGNAEALRAEGGRRWPPCGLVASLVGRPSFFSVHVPSTGAANQSTPPGRHRADRISRIIWQFFAGWRTPIGVVMGAFGQVTVNDGRDKPGHDDVGKSVLPEVR
ncbi:hypothetical protein [Bradyrhizobium arachidis]|uniref:hypothetical protein n=1 Tax=Bradyrhizobium arachidis TaxID=858423 RepID=UPI00216196F9|nr:hypothetical protein [Bradyrhizobium arachidis]